MPTTPANGSRVRTRLEVAGELAALFGVREVVAQLLGFSITVEQGKGQAGNVSSEQVLLKLLAGPISS